jgi:ribosomal-protein-alanine N-acetyltransferase
MSMGTRSTALTVRPANQADLDEVAAIERAVFKDPWSRRSFADLVDRPEVVFLVASDGNATVAYSVVLIAGEESELANLAVAPLMQRQHLGARLLHDAIDAAASRECKEMFLEVRASNLAAIKLYTTTGFNPVGRRVRYYARPVEDAIVMKLGIGDKRAARSNSQAVSDKR